MNDILFLVVGLIGGFAVVYVKKFIQNKAKTAIKDKITGNCSIGKVYKKDGNEPFQWIKFKKIFNLGNGVEWIKSIKEIIDLRKLVIYGVVLGVIFGYGWYKGRLGAPVNFDLRGKSAIIQLNEHFLQIEENGTAKVVDAEGNVLKTIRVRDIPSLRRAMRPYGFKLEPIIIAGGSLGESGAGFEAGAGLSWFKYFKWNLDSFLTNRGLYPIATSYQITNNSGIGIGAGIGYKGDKRVILYYKWKF